jgi:pantetheine-phosphate adenylyltransferase
MSKILAVYAGSFDPLTWGHLDIIARTSWCFNLVVAIGVNPAKKPLFSVEERIKLIEETLEDQAIAAKVVAFNGLLVHYCQSVGAKLIIRGARAVTDFEYELGLAQINRDQDPYIDTFFLPTIPAHSFVSSSAVRELAKNGANIESYVPANIADAVRKKFL